MQNKHLVEEIKSNLKVFEELPSKKVAFLQKAKGRSMYVNYFLTFIGRVEVKALEC